MLKTKLCEMLGIKYPIIQAGMGPFSNNNLCVAAANAGVLGLLSTSGLFSKGAILKRHQAKGKRFPFQPLHDPHHMLGHPAENPAA